MFIDYIFHKIYFVVFLSIFFGRNFIVRLVMNKTWLFILVVVFLPACGKMVEVPPAAVGIVKDKEGYVGDFIPPSAFRLPACFMDPCPSPVYIGLNHNRVTESMDVFLPKSNMQIDDVQVNIVAGIRNDPGSLRQVLTKVSPSIAKGDYWITFNQVYNVYAKERVRAIVRESVAGKELEWLLANRGPYGKQIFSELNKALSKIGSPIEIRQMSFAKLNPPPAIRESFEKAKRRQIELQEADAKMNLDIKKAEAALQVAKRQAAVQLERALAFKAEALAMAKAATPQWLAMRRLEVLEVMAKNNSAVFIPMNMNPAEASMIKMGRR